MNLFITDEDPRVCARNLDDKRVGKLLMEANQMLSLAVKEVLPHDMWEHHVGKGMLTAGFSHKNHPVSIWVRQSFGNFVWTFRHAHTLRKEFRHRFGKEHDSGQRTTYFGTSGLFDKMEQAFTETQLLDRTPFQNSARHKGLGLDFTHLPVPESYRAYLRARWSGDKLTPKWTNRTEPEWTHGT